MKPAHEVAGVMRVGAVRVPKCQQLECECRSASDWSMGYVERSPPRPLRKPSGAKGAGGAGLNLSLQHFGTLG